MMHKLCRCNPEDVMFESNVVWCLPKGDNTLPQSSVYDEIRKHVDRIYMTIDNDPDLFNPIVQVHLCSEDPNEDDVTIDFAVDHCPNCGGEMVFEREIQDADEEDIAFWLNKLEKKNLK